PDARRRRHGLLLGQRHRQRPAVERRGVVNPPPHRSTTVVPHSAPSFTHRPTPATAGVHPWAPPRPPRVAASQVGSGLRREGPVDVASARAKATDSAAESRKLSPRSSAAVESTPCP